MTNGMLFATHQMPVPPPSRANTAPLPANSAPLLPARMDI